MTRMHPDDIRAIIEGVAELINAPRPVIRSGNSIAQQAIALVKSGDIEGSKALLKAASKRKAA